MVTLSPALGMAPLPSLRTVFETPMIAVVLVKLRDVGTVVVVVVVGKWAEAARLVRRFLAVTRNELEKENI
jgi:hypothetical protein